MVNYEEIILTLRREIDSLRIEGTSQRLSTLGDHDYIVGEITGIERSIQKIDAIRKNEEDLNSDDELT